MKFALVRFCALMDRGFTSTCPSAVVVLVRTVRSRCVCWSDCFSGPCGVSNGAQPRIYMFFHQSSICKVLPLDGLLEELIASGIGCF